MIFGPSNRDTIGLFKVIEILPFSTPQLFLEGKEIELTKLKIARVIGCMRQMRLLMLSRKAF